MKVIIAVCAFVGFLCVVSLARVGENYDQSKARYGEPVDTSFTDSGQIVRAFDRPGIKIKAYYYEGRIYRMVYEKQDGEFTVEECRKIVDFNFNGEEVEVKMERFFFSKTYSAAGVRNKFTVNDKVTLDKMLNENKSKKEARDKKNLDGL